MQRIQKLIFLSSAVIGFISILTPVVFHIGTESVYQFWLWGTSLSFNLSSGVVGSNQATELEFLIPALSSMVLILISSSLILKSSLKGLWDDEFNSKISTIGGILMLATPILLIIIWQLVHVVFSDYPTFWGSSGGYNYFMPSFSIYLQFLAGFIAISSILIIRRNK